jgi:hypothetical protein
MTRTEYQTLRRSVRENGRAYTARRANFDISALFPDGPRVDWLACRAKWLANPQGDNRAVIVRLTSFINPPAL